MVYNIISLWDFYNILEACRHSYDGEQTGVEHLVYASSSSVYGSNKKVPYCDSVIIELITKLASNDNLSTVKDVLIDTKLLLGKKKEYLKEGGAFVDEDISHLRKEYL